MTAQDEVPVRRASGAAEALKAGFGEARSRPAALVAVLALLVGGAAGIWFLGLRPQEPGRELGTAGEVRLVAKAARDGETMEVWRGAERLSRLGVADTGRFQRFEMTSDSVNVGGGPAADLVVYGWTGGMHCCITHFVVDGDTGALLGRIEQGDGDPASFVAPERGSAGQAVMPLWDDAGQGQYGPEYSSPLGRVLVSWRGTGGFGLDAAAMKASGPDAPPAFWATNPALVQALIDQGIEADFLPESPKAGRGGMSRAYLAWLERLERELGSATLVAEDAGSFVPLARLLNAYVYKGQAAAGVAEVRRIAGGQGEALEAGLRHYFAVLGQSRWFADLDRLNGGALTAEVNAAGQ
jgi:hypothetical protein